MADYYGPQAYEAFARAFANKMGVSIRVQAGQGGASVDSTGCIMLPSMDTYQTRKQCEDTCAQVVPEIAHIYSGSHTEFETQNATRRAEAIV